jgi:hypothetical protein
MDSFDAILTPSAELEGFRLAADSVAEERIADVSFNCYDSFIQIAANVIRLGYDSALVHIIGYRTVQWVEGIKHNC